jgi:hypothetical protein
MTEPIENGEDQIDEQGRNATQQRIDEEGASPEPVDEEWSGGVGSTEPPRSEAPARPAPERGQSE